LTAPRAGVSAAGPHQHPRALQLVAIERELQIAFLDRRVDVGRLGRPGASIPQHHDAGAVAFGNHSLELTVVERVILDVHRQPLRFGIERRTFGNGPREQHAIVLETKVVVQVAREVLLDAEVTSALRRFDPACGFGRLGEVALAVVFL
jgi:hypothetical protein